MLWPIILSLIGAALCGYSGHRNGVLFFLGIFLVVSRPGILANKERDFVNSSRAVALTYAASQLPPWELKNIVCWTTSTPTYGFGSATYAGRCTLTMTANEEHIKPGLHVFHFTCRGEHATPECSRDQP